MFHILSYCTRFFVLSQVLIFQYSKWPAIFWKEIEVLRKVLGLFCQNMSFVSGWNLWWMFYILECNRICLPNIWGGGRLPRSTKQEYIEWRPIPLIYIIIIVIMFPYFYFYMKICELKLLLFHNNSVYAVVVDNHLPQRAHRPTIFTLPSSEHSNSNSRVVAPYCLHIKLHALIYIWQMFCVQYFVYTHKNAIYYTIIMIIILLFIHTILDAASELLISYAQRFCIDTIIVVVVVDDVIFGNNIAKYICICSRDCAMACILVYQGMWNWSRSHIFPSPKFILNSNRDVSGNSDEDESPAKKKLQ